MKIEIWIKDGGGLSKKYEDMGIDLPAGKKYLTAEMIVCGQDVRGYWVSPDIDEDTGTKNILFYTPWDNFSCPWSEQLEYLFKEIIDINESSNNISDTKDEV